MLFISEHNKRENYRTLKHCDEVFHKALKCHVVYGDRHFHVSNPGGEDYDLEYVDNTAAAESTGEVFYYEFMTKGEYYPQYLIYDEGDIDKVSFEAFDPYDGVFFNHLDEYSVVITRLLLGHTGKKVFWADEGIRRFVTDEEAGSIAFTDRCPEEGAVMVVDGIYHDRKVFHIVDPNDVLGTIGLFHDMFFLQWVTDRPLQDIKYVELTVPQVEGLGMLLKAYTAFSKKAETNSVKLVMKRGGASRFYDELIEKYFTIEFTPPDATEENTMFICNYGAFLNVRQVVSRYGKNAWIPESILREDFRREIDEYKEHVFRDKKMLGVLLRGTDYNTVVPEQARPCHIEKVIEVVRAWMRDYDYDAIFVATEDAGYLREMRAAFPGKVLAVAQQRYEARDFVGKTTIRDVQNSGMSEQEERESLNDNTANYFYACYMLSECDSFISNSSSASGRYIVEGFNNGRFRRTKMLDAHDLRLEARQPVDGEVEEGEPCC